HHLAAQLRPDMILRTRLHYSRGADRFREAPELDRGQLVGIRRQIAERARTQPVAKTGEGETKQQEREKPLHGKAISPVSAFCSIVPDFPASATEIKPDCFWNPQIHRQPTSNRSLGGKGHGEFGHSWGSPSGLPPAEADRKGSHHKEAKLK